MPSQISMSVIRIMVDVITTVSTHKEAISASVWMGFPLQAIRLPAMVISNGNAY